MDVQTGQGWIPGAVADAIDRVRKQQNELKHDPNKGARILQGGSREIRAAWYGLKPGEPGVFHVITGAQKAISKLATRRRGAGPRFLVGGV